MGLSFRSVTYDMFCLVVHFFDIYNFYIYLVLFRYHHFSSFKINFVKILNNFLQCIGQFFIMFSSNISSILGPLLVFKEILMMM